MNWPGPRTYRPTGHYGQGNDGFEVFYAWYIVAECKYKVPDLSPLVGLRAELSDVQKAIEITMNDYFDKGPKINRPWNCRSTPREKENALEGRSPQRYRDMNEGSTMTTKSWVLTTSAPHIAGYGLRRVFGSPAWRSEPTRPTEAKWCKTAIHVMNFFVFLWFRRQ